MNTDERLKELEKKVEYLIALTEEKNQNKISLKKIVLISLIVIAAIFVFLFILGLISFYSVDSVNIK
ncbi:hypothetical protein O0Q50_22895 [Priestia aryabhattai]|uniref:Uncharacterized protein n=2 Tax=Priestia TaxID=2800373 RepID=A0AAX6NEW6_PRIAR|nr:hypothetical protein [Priestia aryabhattai]MDU9694034.1 hypothetical protein [Priestia aryabhattai]NGY88660.1 hypothetical protein [Priestia megaterium]